MLWSFLVCVLQLSVLKEVLTCHGHSQISPCSFTLAPDKKRFQVLGHHISTGATNTFIKINVVHILCTITIAMPKI